MIAFIMLLRATSGFNATSKGIVVRSNLNHSVETSIQHRLPVAHATRYKPDFLIGNMLKDALLAVSPSRSAGRYVLRP